MILVQGEKSVTVEQAYNFRKVDEETSTAGRLDEAQLLALGEEGYQAVINLLPRSSDYAVKNEESMVTEQGIAYLHIPVDFQDPTEQDYADFVTAMDACRGKKILIHCAANYRVSVFYAVYAYEHLGWPASRAKQHIESVWRTEDNPPWHRFLVRHVSGEKFT
ncbi:MAG: protein tyrosine phosphatase family protein [Caldilineaceae bacterium]|nr:protein tyrosine phosphatase family protein [Caldilineaceae bacterium]